MLAQFQLGRYLGETRATDEQGLHLGQITLGPFGKTLEEVLVDHEAKHGVAKKFESLVGFLTPTPGNVDMGAMQQ
jgi:hypothetical protein